ncbi:choice-of-anchor P family protein [Microbaculum marinum]|uniref:Choice-of-anchor P family protein n=1 Tax=Microbaculum marinum TaxID=1764581 RepID=A0AAW9RLS7_9HYPH
MRGHFLGGANAVETNAKVGEFRASLNRAAYKSCGCDGTNGKIQKNTVDSLRAGEDGDVASLGKMRAIVLTDRSAKSAVAKNMAVIDSIDLLDGLITADGLRARAKFKATNRRMSFNINRSKFVNLEIAGTPVDSNVGKNTKMNLPGIGTVFLKLLKKNGNFNRRGEVRLEMIRIHVQEENSFGLPIGSVLVVGRAKAGYSRKNIDDIIGGAAYLATLNAKSGDDAQNAVGRPGLLHVGCEGTRGKTKSERVASLDGTGILQGGAGRSTAVGKQTRTGAMVKMTAETEAVSLLDGLVTLESIRAVSRDRIKNGKRISSARGTKVVGLTVAGESLGTIRAKNVKIPVPTVGTLFINEVGKPPAGTRRLHQVNGLRLKANSSSTVLPAGTQLIVSHAQTRAY